MTIEELRKSGLIAYEYVRGSHMYRLNTEQSDRDTGGVFICPKDSLYGLRGKYIEQVADEKNDTVFYEFGRWVELLLKSNPSVLEGLFAPKECVVGKVHPAVQMIIDNKEMFLSKECFKTHYGYATGQIKKARGLNKKIVNPVTERKDVLDFCYTFRNQGSQPMKKYLSDNFLDQKYCGLVSVPNMKDVYGVYYDWAAFFYFEKFHWEKGIPYPYNKFIKDPMEIARIKNRIMDKDFYGYEGIVNPDDYSKSNNIRLSSVHEGDAPITFLYYNSDGYQMHCKDYREYKEWEQKRNPVRYESNLNKNYDSKNMMHCMRLIRMAKELAQGKGFNVVRSEDRDFLMDIRNHKFEYDEIISMIEKEQEEMEEAVKTCTLRDTIDYEKVNDLLIRARKLVYDE